MIILQQKNHVKFIAAYLWCQIQYAVMGQRIQKVEAKKKPFYDPLK